MWWRDDDAAEGRRCGRRTTMRQKDTNVGEGRCGRRTMWEKDDVGEGRCGRRTMWEKDDVEEGRCGRRTMWEKDDVGERTVAMHTGMGPFGSGTFRQQRDYMCWLD